MIASEHMGINFNDDAKFKKSFQRMKQKEIQET